MGHHGDAPLGDTSGCGDARGWGKASSSDTPGVGRGVGHGVGHGVIYGENTSEYDRYPRF